MVLGGVLRRFNRAEKQGANAPAEPPISAEEDGSSQSLMFHTSGNAVKLEDETVTTSEAERSLLLSRTLLLEALTKAGSGNHDRHATDLDIPALLDESAAALDEAALALKVAKLQNMMNRGNPVKKERTKKESRLVKLLADDLSEIRKRLLASMFENNEEELLQSSTCSNLGGDDRGPLVLWATHTGTSQKYALDLAQRLNADAKNLKDVSLKDLSKRKGGRVYFVCSTFGAGRPPRDGEAFFSQLQNCKGTPLKGVEVAVAALGNSAFDHFALFGVALSMELSRAGAREILEVCRVDRSNKPLEAFTEWEEGIIA
jgi:flavodoxin